ncbi:CAP-Gly domain-containing linker protein 1 isoform X2 [Magallana gigas]|uniref:CAP-Gly domain-containing linker protein 1 isoform X2 n=1 Tax=Magallana gigas TaxID=29159 RepID=UPI00333FAFAF
MKKGSNGHIQREELMMTLLDDSSETDELQLPPLKGKKQVRRKRNPYSSPSSSHGGICNCWQFMKMLIILLLVCSVTVMGFITVWLSNQVKDLQQQLNEVKGSSLQTSVDELKQQIQSSIKKDLVNVTQSPKEMADVKLRLSSLTSKVNDQSSALEAVSKSQPGSQVIVNQVNTLSKQVPIISNTIGDLGVDVKAMKLEVEKLKEKVEKELADLKKQQTPEMGSGGRESGGRESGHVDLDTEKLENLSNMIQLVNNSLWSELPKIQSKLSSHEVYLSALQNITANLQTQFKALNSDHSSILKDHKGMDQDSGEGTAQTKLLIHQVIEDMGLANQTSPSESLDNLSVKIDSITSTVGTLRDQFKLMKDSQGTAGSADTGSIQTSLQALNRSIEVLKEDFHTLMGKVGKQSNTITELSKTVEVLKHFSASLDKDHREMVNGQTTSAAPPTPTIRTPVVKSDLDLLPASPTASSVPTSTAKAPDVKQDKDQVPTTKLPPHNTEPIVKNKNKPPVAKTEGHITITLPIQELYLNGTGSTDDEDVVLYHWEQKDGPSVLNMFQEDEAIARATGDFIPGQYIFELQVWDAESLTSKKTLTVDVQDKPSEKSVRSTLDVSQPTSPPEVHKFITMKLVNSYEDLETGVRRWDKDGDGLIDVQDLPDYMPDPPSQQQLEMFDFNHDGLYNIDELAVALGFQPWPKDQPKPGISNKKAAQ